MSFYFKVGEKKRTVSGLTFALIMIPFMAFGLFAVWCMFGGLYKFGGIWLCIAWVLMFGELTINGRLYTMITNSFIRHAISLPCSIAAIIYYFA